MYCVVGNTYCLYSFGEKSFGKGSFGRLLKRKDDEMINCILGNTVVYNFLNWPCLDCI
jgi:hypothetical protein